MSILVYNYTSTNKDGIPIIPSLTVVYEIKLVVLNTQYQTDGNVVDSSDVFYVKKLSLKGGDLSVSACIPNHLLGICVNLPETDTTKTKGTDSRILVNLNEKEFNMSESEIFTKFWQRWSGRVKVGGPKIRFNEFQFGLQVSQKFEGNNLFAGFSKVDYIFVPYFNGNCTPKDCSYPKFDFPDITVADIFVEPLTFNKTVIAEKQINASKLKFDYEQTLVNYKAQLIAQSFDLILTTEDYQPTNWVNVITRLLEYQEATLSTSLDYAADAGLDDVYSLLDSINTEINDLSALYPEIIIEDGEGFPYGDGIPGLYSFFGWAKDVNFQDIFSLVTKDLSSTTNFLIITQNGDEIIDTRTCGYSTLFDVEFVEPKECDPFGYGVFSPGDIIVGTVSVTDYVGPDINFIHSNYGFELDVISSGVTLTRGEIGALYNSNVESEWNDTISPSGTTWNSEYTDGLNFGFSNLDVVNTRTFGTFYEAFGGCCIGERMKGLELIMHDETTDEYWTFKFTGWTSGQQGGGFEYTRRLINQLGITLSFQDTMEWKQSY